MLTVIPIPAFEDNYIWLLHNGREAVAVDAGDAEPLLDYVAIHELRLIAVLDTHHHGDHTGGNADLLRQFPDLAIYGDRRIATVNRPIKAGARLEFPELPLSLEVIGVPGHTSDHLAYYGANCLFCGDALFSCGCGKLFEGTPPQAFASLERLAALPDQTLVYPAHEYTLENIRFAKMVEPHNAALLDREVHDRETRNHGRPTLPASLALEKRTNPFLRCREPAVVEAASSHIGRHLDAPGEVFAVLREWRNAY
jgi:hydroxyacylglutathione hydrolase